MEIDNQWWLVPVIILAILVLPYLLWETVAWMLRFISKLIRTAREEEARRWKLPDKLQKWLRGLFHIFLGYMGGLIAVMVSITVLQIVRGVDIPASLVRSGATSDDAGWAILIVATPAIVMMYILVSAMCIELIMTTLQDWKQATTRKDKILVLLPPAIALGFAVIAVISSVVGE